MMTAPVTGSPKTVIIDGNAFTRAVERLRNAQTYRSTGVVDDVTRLEFHAAITRGMGFLDEYMPGWKARVEVDELNLGSPCQCVLGQVDHNFYEAMLRAGHAEVDDRGIIQPDYHWARQHGFSVTNSLDFEAWDALTACWQERLVIDEGLSDTVIDSIIVERDLVRS